MAYRVINHIAEVEIPKNTGDFRLMSRRVVDNVTQLCRRAISSCADLCHSWASGRLVSSTTASPALAGRSHYRFYGSWSDGLSGVVGFSRYPLQVISVGGILLAGLGVSACGRLPDLKLSGVAFPVGNPTIVIVVSFFSGIQLLSLGVMGEYVGRIYDESRRRPRYIVESSYGWDEDESGR